MSSFPDHRHTSLPPQPLQLSRMLFSGLHMPGLLPLFAALAVALLIACGGTDTASSGDASGGDPSSAAEPVANSGETQTGDQPPPLLWRYVNSGWVSPVEYFEANPYLDELHAFVITTQEELDAFNRSAISKRTSGNSTSLGRIDFLDSVLLAAYYIWRPVQGDPLSVVDLNVSGNSAVVDLELDDDAQGRLYPYLLAPMTMVSVNRSLFPRGEPVEFVFQLNGEPNETVSAIPN